jgi:hypothetical protein
MIGPFNLVIPTGVLKNASDVFYILDPDVGGANTFTVPLSADGLDPPTYWACRTLLEEGTYNAMTNMTTQEFKTYVDELSVIRGRTPVGSVTAFKNSVQIDSGNFRAFIASLGLVRIVPPIV